MKASTLAGCLAWATTAGCSRDSVPTPDTFGGVMVRLDRDGDGAVDR